MCKQTKQLTNSLVATLYMHAQQTLANETVFDDVTRTVDLAIHHLNLCT